MGTYYLSHEILTWGASATIVEPGDIEKIKKPYEFHLHAENLIAEKNSPLHLSDAIGNLKKAITHRLQAIETKYKLKKLFPKKDYGPLESLEVFDLAKPYIIKSLMEIRNQIEHQYQQPPNNQRCKELSDITWYFLKSTDRFVQNEIRSIEVRLERSFETLSKYEGTIDIKVKEKRIFFRGWIKDELISDKKLTNFIKTEVEEMSTGERWKDQKIHRDKTKNDIWLVGELFPDQTELIDVLTWYFRVY